MSTLSQPLEIAPPSSETSIKPVRIAIVGANFGGGIARNLAAGNRYIALSGICDLDLEKAASLSKELNVPRYASLEEILNDSEIEAVGLFTGPVGRAKIISKILEAGKHVMTTKPFELDLLESQAVLELAAKRKLTLHLNSPAPVPAEDMKQIQEWIKTQDLGRPISMRAETWANYTEFPNGSWYDDPFKCPAAPILRLGVYFLNEFAALMGEPFSAYVVESRIRTGRPTSDNAQLAITFKNGAIGNIFASFCIDDGIPWRDQVTLNFERGTITRWIERHPGPDMAIDFARVELRKKNQPLIQHKTKPGAFAGWYDWEAFHHATRRIGDIPPQNSAAILFGMKLLTAMKLSSQSGQPVVIP